MRKILMFAFAVVTSLVVAVAEPSPSIEFRDNLVESILPAVFSFDGMTKFTPDYESETEQNAFVIYDSEFREIKTITVPTKSIMSGSKGICNGSIYDDTETVERRLFRPMRWSLTPEGYNVEETLINFTQTLFNNDEKYEYISPNFAQLYEEIRDGNCKTERYEVGASSCDVRDEDGNVIMSFDFDGYIMDPWSKSIHLLTFGGNTYLSFSVYKSEGDNYDNKFFIYKVDRPSSSAKRVAVIDGGIRVRPTLTKGDTPVEVTLDEPAEADMVVTVVGMNGSEVYSAAIDAGQSGISLNLNRLPQGIYVVNVGGREYTKLIIR